ncbi:MAG: T9SS type A sorting domain-containing protein [Bacteroidota bacterium]
MYKIVSFALLLFICGNAGAQNANWGWGIPANVVPNGSSITISAFDPVLSQTQSISQSGIANYFSSEGIVAWVTNGSTVGAAIYDMNLHQWVYTTFNSNSGNMVTNVDGVVAWVSDAGTVGGAVYNPDLQQWVYTTFNGNSGNDIINNDGTIAWVSDAGTVGGAVYDAGLEQWVYTTFNGNAGNSILNEQGVISFVSDAGTVGGAVYDPAAQGWKYTTFNGNSGNDVINQNGIIAFISDAGTVGGAVYNPNTQNWVYTTFNSNSGNNNLAIIDGSIQWYSSGSFYMYGYNLSSGNWESNYNTLNCKLFISDNAGNAPFITQFSCLTIGASLASYACGDGHTITRRWAWKQYGNPGSYQPVLTIFNSNQNSTCSGQVQVSGTSSLHELENNGAFSIIPNPVSAGSGWKIESVEKISEIRVYNSLGALVYSKTGSDSNSLMIEGSEAGLSPGIYVANIHTGDLRTVNLKLIVE